MNYKDYAVGIVIGFAAATIAFAPAKCQAQTTYYYGPQGQAAGSAMQSGNTTYYYGPQGQAAGTAMQSGSTTYLYGPQGQSAGVIMAPVAPAYTPTPMYVMPPTQSLTPMYDSIFGR